MSTKTAIIMSIAALLGVVAMIAVARHDADNRPGTTKDVGRLLKASQLPIDSVIRLTLTRAGEPRMVFERTGAVWNQVEPFAHPVDPFSMRQFSGIARELTSLETLDAADLRDGLTMTALQLQPPLAEIAFAWPEGSLTLKLGRRSVGGRAFLQVGTQPAIHVVDAKLHERALEMDAKEWRDRAIFHNAGVESSLIESEQGQGVRVVLSRERKQWKMLEPVQTRIDPVGLDVYLQDIGRATVSGFVLDQPTASDLAKFGLNSPVAMLTIANARSAATQPQSGAGANSSNDIQRLLIGSRTGANSQDRFGLIEGRPVVVKISEAALKALYRLPKDLADPVASGVPAADVKAIVIRDQKGKEFRLERELDIWKAPDHNSATVSTAQVQELLDQLTRLRAPVVEFKAYPRELEIAMVTLFGYDSKAIDTIRIAKDKDTDKIAMENGDNVLRVFPPAVKVRMTAEDFGLGAD